MTPITAATMKRLAELARIQIDPSEFQYYIEQLTNLLLFIECLQQIDTTTTLPLTNLTEFIATTYVQ